MKGRFLHKLLESRHHSAVFTYAYKRSLLRRLGGPLLVGFALAAEPSVWAAPEGTPPTSGAAAEAAVLKQQGDALMDALDYPGALKKYEDAYAKHADAALLYNQGRALELMGRFPEALDLLRRFDAQASPELHAKLPNLAQLILAIEEQTCELSITVKVKGDKAPRNLTVKLGNEVIGGALVTKKRVNAQDGAILEVTADGYEPYRDTIPLPKRGNKDFTVALAATDKTAVLRVESPVAGAKVRVDGKEVGQVPTEVRLAPGAHTVVLSAVGYNDNEITVELGPTDVRTERIEPGSAPAYTQWWFWTIGLGVLAAGGGAGLAYALLTERSPDEGSIAPCTTPVFAGPQADSDCEPTASYFPSVGRTQPTRVRPSGAFQIGPVPVFRLEF